ncbi:WD domain, G-beta repeat family protein [Leishmania donovani]|uniref:Arp2/3 complex 41 kDa subunit n=1 Tax=Leishmania donovani TaxID=5661 RepID=A0A504XXD6_LEIDO|nr:WD domain, G-beta repeat family protein [Leishmania donovani]
MVSVCCVTCVTSDGDSGTTVPRLVPASPPPPPLAALAFSHDGTRAAYAVRRGKALPRYGEREDACSIFIASTNTPAHCASSTSSGPGAAVAPFAQWTMLQVLTGSHDAPITALAWCQRTGALLSTSADRGACVWVPRAGAAAAKEANSAAAVEGGSVNLPAAVAADVPFCAVPQLVILSTEVRLCPTCVAWSAEGTKLYIGTSGGTVAVGRYDAQHKWWICRLLSDHRRTTFFDPSVETAAPSSARACSVTALAAHPVENTRLAVARLDGTVQVLSTHIKSVDGALGSSGQGTSGSNAGATAKPFHHVYLSHLLPCWVHGVAWSPSGQQLAVVGHDSGLHTWDWGPVRSSSAGGERSSNDDCSGAGSGKCEAVHTVTWLRQLPLLRCEFASEDVLVAVGFEGRLHAFESTAASAQPGFQRQRTWKLMPEHAATQRTEGSAQLLRRETAHVAANDREKTAAACGRHNLPSQRATAAAKHVVTLEGQQPPARIVGESQAAVDGALVAKSVRQVALDFFERGRAAAAADAVVATSTRGRSSVPGAHSSTENNAADHATGAARQQVTESPPHTSLISLLVRIPSGEKSTAAEPMDVTFVSAGHDSRVHLWRVRHTTLARSKGVYFKKQVLKLGMDGTSLCRLIVVTDTHVYVCVPSGGITRAIAVRRIERVTLAAAAGGAGSGGPTMPSAKPQREKAKSLFASVVSRRGDIAGRTNLQVPHHSRPDSADGDAGGALAVSSTDASPAASSRQGASSAADKAGREVPASVAAGRWVTIVTLGIAQEAALALQFYSAVDGEDFVAALRKASHISAAAVFNLPAEEGPIDASGQLLSLPARCEDPVWPRVLKREAGDTNMGNRKPDVESIRAVEEVQLSPPRSPRSPTAPPQPTAHPTLLPHDRSGSGNIYAPTVEETRWHSPPQAPSRLQKSTDGSPLAWRTPSPLRTAPHRKVPAPPPSVPSQQLQLSAPPPLKTIRGPVIEGRGGGGSHNRGSSATQSLRDAANEPTRTTSQSRLPRLIFATASSSAMCEGVPSCPKAAAPVSTTKAEAVPRRSLFADELGTAQVVDPAASSLSAAAPRTAFMATEDGARDAPVHVDALQAELAAQSATVARLQRSLQAHESLLIELADARADVRGLQATLAERNEQCDEWQAACSQAEQRVSILRRQHERMLAEQQERLRRAHHAELEAVQAAFEEYDARMSAFLEQLKQDHREEEVQWQRERRVLLLQLHEQQRQQQEMRDVEEHRRVRAAGVVARAHYEAQRRRVPAPQVSRRPLASSAECNPASAAWPRAEVNSPSDSLLSPPPPPRQPPSHTTSPFSAHRLMNGSPDVDDEVNHVHPAARHGTAALTRRPHAYFQAHLQAPPSYPRGGSIPDAHDVGKGTYTPSRRSYV